MEAGLLAIASGRGVPLTAENTRSRQEDWGSVGASAFRSVMEQNKNAAQDNERGEAQAEGDLLADVTVQELDAASAEELLQLQKLLSPEEWEQFLQGEGGLLVLPAQLPQLSQLAQQVAPQQGQESLTVSADLFGVAPTMVGAPLPQDELGQALPQEEMNAVLLALDASGEDVQALNVSLSDEELQALAQWVAQLKALSETADAQDAQFGAGVSVVMLLPATMQGGWHAPLRESKIESLALGDVAQGKTDAISSALSSAIEADDLSGLSDADLAKLDALVDKIAQRGLRPDNALGSFGTMLEEQLTELRTTGQASAQDTTQVSSLSASHASHQTRAADDGLQLRSMHFAGLTQANNAGASEQVKVSVTQALRDGLDRVTIQLDPADLGRVDVRMEVGGDGRTQLLVQADNRDTLDLLQRDARALQRALQEAGIHANLQDMAFNMSERDGQQSETGTDDAITSSYEESVEHNSQQELANETLSASYALSVAQGLDIKV